MGNCRLIIFSILWSSLLLSEDWYFVLHISAVDEGATIYRNGSVHYALIDLAGLEKVTLVIYNG
jgi:hypothetical protein